ncbi:MAG TPA: acireductone synthase [Vicinamibacterales bacterium]
MSESARSTPAQAILLDIEGTTTPIAFVYETLFPYARAHLKSFLDAHASHADGAALIERLRRDKTMDAEAPAGGSVVEYVEWLMDRDRKSTALKELQGLIWEDGYRRGELTGEIFPDVAPALERWHRQAIGAGIFSSGSVLAQRRLFGHSTAGDLTPLLRWYFDTTTGSKRDHASYDRIARSMGLPADAIVFVSDVVEELDAAREAGMQTRLSLRPGNAPQPAGHGHRPVRGFDELDFR